LDCQQSHASTDSEQGGDSDWTDSEASDFPKETKSGKRKKKSVSPRKRAKKDVPDSLKWRLYGKPLPFPQVTLY